MFASESREDARILFRIGFEVGVKVSRAVWNLGEKSRDFFFRDLFLQTRAFPEVVGHSVSDSEVLVPNLSRNRGVTVLNSIFARLSQPEGLQ